MASKPKTEHSGASSPEALVRYIGVIERPHMSEKAYRLAALRQYVFVIGKRATKRQVQEAVERRYGVTVIAVQTMRDRRKSRRWRGVERTLTPRKKAIVTLPEGQKLELA
ncbi:MAG: 50S ribosomal protein L23 [bacterium]|nr:50S ribosomal protein L23 [bacterium]